VGQEYFTGALGQEDIHICLHEVGHTFGLDNFYDWTPAGQCCFLADRPGPAAPRTTTRPAVSAPHRPVASARTGL
jgi:hypothetical protein